MKKTNAFLIVSCLCVLLAANTFANEQTLTIAIDSSKPPMEFIDSNGDVVGFEIDFIRAMAREAGFTPVLKEVAWKDIFTGLTAGKYDAICASVSITETRKENFLFSEPYINIAQAVIVSESSNISDVTGLRGLKIAVKSQTTSLYTAKNIEKVKIVELPVVEEAITALVKGEVDAVICDGPVAAYYTSKNQDRGLKIAAILPSDPQEQYAMVVRPGDTRALTLLNKGIRSIKRQLIDIDLQKKWFAALFNKNIK